jgi:hypothetical protein
MGHRTLSLNLVLRALFLDGDAYAELRDDDNPFIEGLFLLVIIGVVTAVLGLLGQLLAWASTPDLNAIKEIVLQNLQRMSWWPLMAASPGGLEQFQRWYDLGWQIFPALFGAPSPARAAFNIVAWPAGMLLSWLFYGILAHLFARLFRGTGTLGQTFGTTALAWTPLLLRGLEIVPFLVIGGVLSTWQLICRYKAIRMAHKLSWGAAFWATLLPFLVYLLLWIGLGLASFALFTAFAAGGR